MSASKVSVEDTEGKEREDIPLPSYSDLVSNNPGVKKCDWKGAVIKDRSLWFKCKFGSGRCAPELRFNPVTSLLSVALIIAFLLWCILAQEHANKNFGIAKSWITKTFTWLYIGSQDIWALVIIAIYFSKYGAMKLGSDDEEPEYNDGTWFAMLFACGVGVGLFFYGVAEPMFHYAYANRYYNDKFMPDNELAQNAINLTLFHWGLHGWIVYVIVGLLLAFMTFRKGMPMTMKTCFYPLIGDRIYGWIGDLIDTLSIITTLFGVCTSLGLGTIQVNTGLNYISPSVEISIENQVIIIWVITAVATISVVSGVGVGIRRLSELCFGLGMFIMMLVFFLEDTWFILNLYTQSIGYYFQYIIQLGFHCDAFELSSPSYGGAEGRDRAYPDTTSDGPEGWMDGWTIFYWGWWISWSPFVGMFIAKISRGRTIRQFINGTLTAPIIYTFMWLIIFGGSAIKQERTAAGEGLCCTNWNMTVLQNPELAVNASVVCNGNTCNPCSYAYLNSGYGLDPLISASSSDSLVSFLNKSEEKNHRLGVYTDDRGAARLSCLATEQMWFALMYTYGDMGPFLSIISLIGIILYFVTSSDSGSLIIDIMAANGDQEPPTLQRVFWALVEGATATALLVAGGKDSLGALQTASIVAGLPYTIILCFYTVALWRALAMESGDLNPYGADFRVGLVDPFATLQPMLWWCWFKNIFLCPLTVYSSLVKHKISKGTAVTLSITAMLSFVLWIVLMILELEVKGIYALAWVFYLVFATVVTYARHTVRSHHNINGNPIEDFFASMLMFPSVGCQLETVSRENGLTELMPERLLNEAHASNLSSNSKDRGLNV